jgi:hypothetical protein
MNATTLPSKAVRKVKAYRYDRNGRDFDPALFKPVANIPYRNKPSGGCWFSPIRTTRRLDGYEPYGWAEWVVDNDFRTIRPEERREFVIEGKILVIDGDIDPADIPAIIPPGLHPRDNYGPDFEFLVELGYDAILLTQEGLRRFHLVSGGGFELYGWDCESVLVLNPQAVRPLP